MALVLAGILVAGFGVRLALEAPRPRNLIGMLLAPLGLCVALVGVGRLLSPGFFGREARGHRALRIMPAGDLAMLDSPAGSKDRGGYRGPLWARLAGRGVDFVGATRGGPFAIDRDHEGFEGLTVDGLAAHLEADLPACAPDVILLYAGSVDLAAGAAPEVVVGRLSALIDATISRAPRARLLVAALVGAAGIDPARVAAVNQALRQAVLDRAARGERVRFVDLAARVGK
ncbi:MAG TPA: GDSL-type esterase/lipase family protein, partial [Polyangia bacterium]|nr:GDSL-type esterase/lipase family protein [Polyangia bacterium]